MHIYQAVSSCYVSPYSSRRASNPRPSPSLRDGACGGGKMCYVERKALGVPSFFIRSWMSIRRKWAETSPLALSTLLRLFFIAFLSQSRCIVVVVIAAAVVAEMQSREDVDTTE